MRVVASVFAECWNGFLGGAAARQAPIRGRSVLAHTLSRLARVEGLDRRCVVVTAGQSDAAASAVRDAGVTGVEVLALDDDRRPRRSLTRSARAWSLEAWRGPLCSATWFDEFVEAAVVARVLDHFRCDAVLCVSACQAALDPEIASAMVRHAAEHAEQARFTFTQAPPGIAGVILTRAAVRELLENEIPLGVLLTYRPEIPQGDPITRPACMRVDPGVARTAARLTGDTRRSRELLEAAFADLGDDADATQLCGWVAAPPAGGGRGAGRDRAGPLPVEVELELTTVDSLPATTLRPRGPRVPARGPVDVEAAARLFAELGVYDDRLVVLGGFGDPLLHPRFAELCRAARQAGVFGLAVTTPLVELSEASLSALLESGVDVLEVLLDADTPGTYSAVHGAARYECVLGNIARVQAARQTRLIPQPLVVPSLVRCAATLAEMGGFYDRWIRATGSAVIRGANDYCGELPGDTLLRATPAIRGPCRRLASRLMLLADGKAVACSQDFRGQMSMGDWKREALADIWRGAAMNEARGAHAALTLDRYPLCIACGEWCRE